MTLIRNHLVSILLPASASSMILLVGSVLAQPVQKSNNDSMDANKGRVVEHWTKERMAIAAPRDLVIDPRGLGYLRNSNGSLKPYGHQVAAEATSQNGTPFAKPSGGGGNNGDSTPPSISGMNPGSGDEIGASHTFSATVIDASGIKSASFMIQYPDGVKTQSFNANPDANDVWTANLQGFTDGSWRWWIVAKDEAGKGGNSATSNSVDFTVNTGGSGGGSGGGGSGADIITNAAWTGGGAVETAVGRIYFEMPGNAKRKGPWSGYVCSGTVIVDNTIRRSVILTAAHCVYDDVNNAFARNVLFIPNQADTTGSGTDLNCSNDPMGCWVADHGVVDVNWTTTTFPSNTRWDYAYYVVNDTGAHAAGSAWSPDSLEEATGDLSISFSMPDSDDGVAGKTSIDFTHALGYSYSDDPNFMYCAEDMTSEGDNNWWLASCELSGGSSGGPWIQPMDTAAGNGPLISLNSWGYTNSQGMAGPKLFGTSAECLFETAKLTQWTLVSTADGEAGIVEVCP